MIAWIFGWIGKIAFFGFVGLGLFAIFTFTIGEMFDCHDEIRRFFFWVRGRDQKTGKPTRRFYLP